MPEDLAVPVDATGEPAGTGSLFAAFRRLGAGRGRVALALSVFEELYGPSRHQARIEVEQQRRLGQPAPAPTDPPESGPAGTSRPPGRFKGLVVLRRR